MNLRVMTFNLGGGVKHFSGTTETAASKAEAMSQLMRMVKPDVLAVQEVSQYTDADGNLQSMMQRIAWDAGFDHQFYGETLSMKRNMQIKKDLMINGLFNDWWDWSKGNGLFSRVPFSRLGDANKEGDPRNVPIFQPLVYEGSRDTDPRYVILSRLKQEPFPFLLNLHLTTLTGERGPNAWQDAVDAAVAMRQQQVAKVMGLIEEHVLARDLPVILMGDFNARPEEYTLHGMLEEERGFVRMKPSNPVATHPVAGELDHIFFFPSRRLQSYRCTIIESELAHRISDHLPVVADLEII